MNNNKVFIRRVFLAFIKECNGIDCFHMFRIYGKAYDKGVFNKPSRNY
jgi:hypothetical protein